MTDGLACSDRGVERWTGFVARVSFVVSAMTKTELGIETQRKKVPAGRLLIDAGRDRASGRDTVGLRGGSISQQATRRECTTRIYICSPMLCT